MKQLLVLIGIAVVFAMQSMTVSAARVMGEYYGTKLCSSDQFDCIQIKKGQSWRSLFPDEDQRDIVQRVNRTNMGLWRSKTIAVPKNLDKITLLDVSPFPLQIHGSDQNSIIVDQDKLAWGAYNRSGQLIKWGAISSGKDYCPDIRRSCNTHTGIFNIFNKKDSRCHSNIFPIGRGGAKMPYCMFFYKGFAMHGSNEVPGYRDSHGCVRLFTQDAKWLNEEFVILSRESNGFKGTRIVVQDLINKRN